MGERKNDARITAGRAVARLGVGATWGVVMLALTWGGAWLGIWIVDLAGTSALRVVGLVIGVVLAIVVCHRSRLWIQQLRLHLMASDGITATATVRGVDRYHTYGIAPNRTIYTVNIQAIREV